MNSLSIHFFILKLSHNRCHMKKNILFIIFMCIICLLSVTIVSKTISIEDSQFLTTDSGFDADYGGSLDFDHSGSDFDHGGRDYDSGGTGEGSPSLYLSVLLSLGAIAVLSLIIYVVSSLLTNILGKEKRYFKAVFVDIFIAIVISTLILVLFNNFVSRLTFNLSKLY